MKIEVVFLILNQLNILFITMLTALILCTILNTNVNVDFHCSFHCKSLFFKRFGGHCNDISAAELPGRDLKMRIDQ